LADEDGGVLFRKVTDGVIDAEALDEATFLVGGVADRAEDAEEVEARDGVFVAKLLNGAREDLGDGEGGGDGRGEAGELL
jgi:hypothetical protein